MAGGGVRVTGLTRVTRQLKALGLEIDDLKDAFSAIADAAAQRIIAHTPRGKTGKLAASVRGNRAQSKAVVRAGRAAVPYAGPINYGWPVRHIAPALFMQKGDQEIQPIATTLLGNEIDKQIRKRDLA